MDCWICQDKVLTKPRWLERIARAESGDGFDAADMFDANNWESCRVGELVGAGLPIVTDAYGPVDAQLWCLGKSFGNAVVVDSAPRAFSLAIKIEARAILMAAQKSFGEGNS